MAKNGDDVEDVQRLAERLRADTADDDFEHVAACLRALRIALDHGFTTPKTCEDAAEMALKMLEPEVTALRRALTQHKRRRHRMRSISKK